MTIRWSARARSRALEAVDYIEKDRPLAALEWLEGLERRVETLARHPEQGRVVPEWGGPAVREVLYAPFRIIYQVSEGEIEILTLRHMRRDQDTHHH